MLLPATATHCCMPRARVCNTSTLGGGRNYYGEWLPCNDGHHRHVLSGWPDWKRLGRLGQLHCLSSARLDFPSGTKQPAWSSHYTPYSIDLPQSIWRPPSCPGPRSPSFVDTESFGKLMSTSKRMPLRTNLHIPAFRTLYKQLVRPAQFSPEQFTRLPAKDEEKLFDDCWIEVVSQWSFCIQHSDVQGLWKAFNTLAESFPVSPCNPFPFPKNIAVAVLFQNSFCSRLLPFPDPIAHGGAQATVERKNASQTCPSD